MDIRLRYDFGAVKAIDIEKFVQWMGTGNKQEFPVWREGQYEATFSTMV